MIYFDIKLLIIIGFFNATLQKPINKLNLQEGKFIYDFKI